MSHLDPVSLGLLSRTARFRTACSQLTRCQKTQICSTPVEFHADVRASEPAPNRRQRQRRLCLCWVRPAADAKPSEGAWIARPSTWGIGFETARCRMQMHGVDWLVRFFRDTPWGHSF